MLLLSITCMQGKLARLWSSTSSITSYFIMPAVDTTEDTVKSCPLFCLCCRVFQSAGAGREGGGGEGVGGVGRESQRDVEQLPAALAADLALLGAL